MAIRKKATRKKSTKKKAPAKESMSRKKIRRRQGDMTIKEMNQREKKTGSVKQVRGRVKSTSNKKTGKKARRYVKRSEPAKKSGLKKKIPNAKGLKPRNLGKKLGKAGIAGAVIGTTLLTGKGVYDTIKASNKMNKDRKARYEAKKKNSETVSKMKKNRDESLIGLKKKFDKVKKKATKRKVTIGPAKKTTKKKVTKKPTTKKPMAKKTMKKSSKVSSTKSKGAKLKMTKWKTKMGMGEQNLSKSPMTVREKKEAKTNAMALKELQKLRMRLDKKNLKKLIDQLDD